MCEEIRYPYSDDNLLERSQSYQRSPFHGKSFLVAYENSRLEKLKILEKNDDLANKNAILLFFNLDAEDYVHELPDEEIDVTLLFNSILIHLEKNISSETIDYVINVFIKKFEIKKRIFLSYNKEFKETSTNYLNVLNYILFSTICLLKYEKTHNLKYLNTSLKLNDTICSQIHEIDDIQSRSLCSLNLRRELNYVSSLSTIKGIQ